MRLPRRLETFEPFRLKGREKPIQITGTCSNPLGQVPPAAFEAYYYHQLQESAMAEITLRDSRGGSVITGAAMGADDRTIALIHSSRLPPTPGKDA